jgi:DNA-binding CsgD family transcriptional regulator
VTSGSKTRARDKIARLSTRGLELVDFWRQASEVIAFAVPYYWSPCWYTLDPASLLITSHFNQDLNEMPSEWLAAEYYEDDVNKLSDIARSRRGISTLHEATGGDPTGSPRWQENMKYGGDQEMLCALRTATGEAWGALGLYRDKGRPLFDTDELAFISTVSKYLAEGARRALLVGEAKESEGLDGPGLMVLSSDWDIESMTPGLERLLHDLPGGDRPGSTLPAAVIAVASRALRTAGSSNPSGEVAMARVLSFSGNWMLLHGVTLASADGDRAAVIFEPAHPARITPLLMSAYGLTQREQDVTRLVLQGCSTTEIASELFISPHTVQEHLKHVFEKTGVRSRRDLVGKVFFAHYEPRVRDNEMRASAGRPLRGDPVSGARRSPRLGGA